MSSGMMMRAVLAGLLLASSALAPAKDKIPDVTHDGLERVPSEKVQVVYKRPGVDFSQYKRVALLDCEVAFRKNWQREHSAHGLRVTSKDMERIKQGLADDFRAIFTDELQKTSGYPLVTEAAEDVLVLRPAIVNLDVAAPDVMTAGRSRSFATSAGEMTLYIELYDSVSGEILARVIDAREAPDSGRMEWQTSVSNRAEADRMLRKWAVLARQALDRAHGKP